MVSLFNGFNTGFYTTNQLRTELEALGIQPGSPTALEMSSTTQLETQQQQQQRNTTTGSSSSFISNSLPAIVVTDTPVANVGYVECILEDRNNSNHNNTPIVGFEIIRTLRKCIYGKVKHAVLLSFDSQSRTWTRTDSQVAVKIMNKGVIATNVLAENPLTELSVQSTLSNPGHPNVLSLVTILEDFDNIYAVLPFCDGGELFASVQTSGAFTEDAARFYFTQIVSGLSYLHNVHGIIHRDMSLENILLSDDFRVARIIDFGLAIKVTDVMLRPSGAIGKVVYMPPEIYRNEGPYDGRASDIWSLGVMLFIMVAGAPPFERPDVADARFILVSNGQLGSMLDSWGISHISSSVKDLLTRILIVSSPEDRLSLDGIMSHPWMMNK